MNYTKEEEEKRLAEQNISHQVLESLLYGTLVSIEQLADTCSHGERFEHIGNSILRYQNERPEEIHFRKRFLPAVLVDYLKGHKPHYDMVRKNRENILKLHKQIVGAFSVEHTELRQK